jgi:hydrogenase maturation protease
VLVIGCGNADRGDDAAGLLVARRLRELGVEAREQSGEATDLLAALRAVPAGQPVVLVDAAMTGSPAGCIACWNPREGRLVSGALRCSTHDLGVAEAVELARSLGGLPENLRVFGIEGSRFEVSAQPSPEVLAAVEELSQRIARGD